MHLEDPSGSSKYLRTLSFLILAVPDLSIFLLPSQAVPVRFLPCPSCPFLRLPTLPGCRRPLGGDSLELFPCRQWACSIILPLCPAAAGVVQTLPSFRLLCKDWELWPYGLQGSAETKAPALLRSLTPNHRIFSAAVIPLVGWICHTALGQVHWHLLFPAQQYALPKL